MECHPGRCRVTKSGRTCRRRSSALPTWRPTSRPRAFSCSAPQSICVSDPVHCVQGVLLLRWARRPLAARAAAKGACGPAYASPCKRLPGSFEHSASGFGMCAATSEACGDKAASRGAGRAGTRRAAWTRARRPPRWTAPWPSALRPTRATPWPTARCRSSAGAPLANVITHSSPMPARAFRAARTLSVAGCLRLCFFRLCALR